MSIEEHPTVRAVRRARVTSLVRTDQSILHLAISAKHAVDDQLPIDGKCGGASQTHVGPWRGFVVEGHEHHLDTAVLQNLDAGLTFDPRHELGWY